ncbi:HEAT repeats [uncultured archaeon]|nr:HEAT repeats [uncultured archaeon]
MPDRSKPKARQASLVEQQSDKPDTIDKLVSQAFDSDPKIRLRTAEELGQIDDPRAIFALIELSSDKDEAVKEAAQRSLGNFKDEKEEIVSLGKLLSERKAAPPQPDVAAVASAPMAPRQSMMPTLEKLFAHYEPKKRESVRRKLMPSLQKMFGFKPDDFSDPLHELDKIAPTTAPSVQIAAQPQMGQEIPKENAPNFPFGRKQEPVAAKAEKSDLLEIDEDDREIVSHEEEELLPEDRGMAEEGFEGNRFYAIAYRIATTPGMGKNDLKREQNRLISNYRKEVEAAFKLASARAAEEGMASFANLKPGMKNLSFAEMPIASITEVPYGPRKKPYLRISLWDQKKEVPLLVPKERGTGISVSDKIALKKVAVDFLIERNEIILLATNKTSIILIK